MGDIFQESYHMSIKILFFGELSESVSASELDLEWSGPVSVGDLFLHFVKDDPERGRQWKDHILYAVNQTQVQCDFMVQDGDEVAFLPPMSGG